MQEWEEERAEGVVLYKKDSAKVVRTDAGERSAFFFNLLFLKGYYLV